MPTQPRLHGSFDLPPSWRSATEQPLNWGAPPTETPASFALPTEIEQPAAPSQPFTPQAAPRPPAIQPQRGSPGDLMRLMEIHENRRANLKAEAEQRRIQREAEFGELPKPPPLTQRHRASFDYVKPLATSEEPPAPVEDDNQPDDWSDEEVTDDLTDPMAEGSEARAADTPSIQTTRAEVITDENADPPTPPEDIGASNSPFESASAPAPVDNSPAQGTTVQRAALASETFTTPEVAAPPSQSNIVSRSEAASEVFETSTPQTLMSSPQPRQSEPFQAPPQVATVQRTTLEPIEPPSQTSISSISQSAQTPTIRRVASKAPVASDAVAQRAPVTQPTSAQNPSSLNAPERPTAETSSTTTPAESTTTEPPFTEPGLGPSTPEIVHRSPSTSASTITRLQQDPRSPESGTISRDTSIVAATQPPSLPAIADTPTQQAMFETAEGTVSHAADTIASAPEVGAPVNQPASRASSRSQRAPIDTAPAPSSQPPAPGSPEAGGWNVVQRSPESAPAPRADASSESARTSEPSAPSSSIAPARPATIPEMPPAQPIADVQPSVLRREPDATAQPTITRPAPTTSLRSDEREEAFVTSPESVTSPDRTSGTTSITETYRPAQSVGGDTTDTAFTSSAPEQSATQQSSEPGQGSGHAEPLTIQRSPETTAQAQPSLMPSDTMATPAPISASTLTQRVVEQPTTESLSDNQIASGWRLPQAPTETAPAPLSNSVQRTPDQGSTSNARIETRTPAQSGNVQRVVQQPPPSRTAVETSTPAQPITEMPLQADAMSGLTSEPKPVEPSHSQSPTLQTASPAARDDEPTIRRAVANQAAMDDEPTFALNTDAAMDSPRTPQPNVMESLQAASPSISPSTGETIRRAEQPARQSSETPQRRVEMAPSNQVAPQPQVRNQPSSRPTTAERSSQPTVQRLPLEPSAREGLPTQAFSTQPLPPQNTEHLSPPTVQRLPLEPSAAEEVDTPPPLGQPSPLESGSRSVQPTVQRLPLESSPADEFGAPPALGQPTSFENMGQPAQPTVQRLPLEPSAPKAFDAPPPLGQPSPIESAPRSVQPTVQRLPVEPSAPEAFEMPSALSQPSPIESVSRFAQPTVQRLPVEPSAAEAFDAPPPLGQPSQSERIASVTATPRSPELSVPEIGTARTATTPSFGNIQRITARTDSANRPTVQSPLTPNSPTQSQFTAPAAYQQPAERQGVVDRPAVQRNPAQSPSTIQRLARVTEPSQIDTAFETPMQPSALPVQRTALQPASLSAAERTTQPSDLPAIRRSTNAPQSEAASAFPTFTESGAAETESEGQTDIYEAMLSAGMINLSRSPSAEPTPGLMRTTLPRDPRVTSSVVEYEPSADSEPIASVPKPGSVESDLLSLIDLPPDTPVIGLRQDQPAPPAQLPANTSAVQRTPAESPDNTPPVHPQSPIQRQAVTPQTIIQRASSEDNSSGEESEADIESLAQKIYSMIRERLRIERERRDH